MVLHDLALAARFCDRTRAVRATGASWRKVAPMQVLTDGHVADAYGVEVVRGQHEGVPLRCCHGHNRRNLTPAVRSRHQPVEIGLLDALDRQHQDRQAWCRSASPSTAAMTCALSEARVLMIITTSSPRSDAPLPPIMRDHAG